VGTFAADRQSDRHLGSRRCRKGSAIGASPAPQNGAPSSGYNEATRNSCDEAGADDRRLAGRCSAEGTAPRDSPSERARIADRLGSLSRPDPQRSRVGFPTAVQEAPLANARGQRPHRATPRRLSLARATAGRRDRRLPLPPGAPSLFEDDRARDLDLRSQGYDVLHFGYRQVSREPERVAALVRGALSP